LTIAAVLIVTSLIGHNHAAVTLWMANGGNPLWLALLLLALCFHSRLGVQVVIEDYVHSGAVKIAALLLNSAAHLLLAGTGLYAVLRVALRGLA
ncbi:MAG TPA: succinate dehydrogenase, hydrophobic membrane anchor protein, partial [Steroidobacteraceae bacterium]